MNITKRMLRFGAAAVAVAIGSNALATGLTVPWYEAFEGLTNNPVVKYNEGASATNLANWVSEPAGVDASFITNMTYTFSQPPDGITFPIKDHGLQSGTPNGISTAYHQKVLKLNTEGGTLSADLVDTSFAANRIYVDTMVNMVISEDPPTITDPTAKIAVWANASSNLVIRHGMYPLVEVDEEMVFGTLFVTNTVTDVIVNPTNWYRLSIALKGESINVNGYSLAQVRLDGVAITNANARDNSWFFSAVANDNVQLSSVAFQGTGFIDDLVVSTSDPFAIVPVGVFHWVYVTQDGSGSFSTDAAFQVADGSSTSIVYTAAQWYRIGSLLEDDEAVGAAAGLATYEQLLTGITADVSNHVSFVAATPTQTGVTNAVPTSWVSGWYNNEADALADTNIATDYLLGLNPTGTYDINFEFTTLAVGAQVTVTVKLSNGMLPLDTTINGTLKVKGKVSLSDASWGTIGTAEVTNANFDENGQYTVSPFAAGSYKFFKAIIE